MRCWVSLPTGRQALGVGCGRFREGKAGFIKKEAPSEEMKPLARGLVFGGLLSRTIVMEVTPISRSGLEVGDKLIF